MPALKVTQVALRPTAASDTAQRPALTPELLAATGARYSRSNEGLEAILARINPADPDASVDAIFRFVDYGHASIADMAPVALFIDGVSLATAYLIWSLSPTAGGQESSTRYIRLDAEGVVEPHDLGVPSAEHDAWRAWVAQSFAHYEAALALWERHAQDYPHLTRVPRSLREDPSDRVQKAVARMLRNYAFDRARYFLPVAARTNMMMVESARAWVGLCQSLLAHPWPEAQRVGALIRDELALAAPRLLKHAEAKPSGVAGWHDEMQGWARRARATETAAHDASPTATLEVLPPPGVTEADFRCALAHHDNRYAPIGSPLARTMVRFGWDAVAFAEIRDLNRHRTGTKYCPLVPQGFYAALDAAQPDFGAELQPLAQWGGASCEKARALVAEGREGIGWMLLGTQFPFEHTTTADKFLYEAELRTGLGAHYRYAQHLHDALALWFAKYPGTRGLILEGTAEPE